LKLNGALVFDQGAPARFDASAVSRSIREHRETHMELQFAEGNASVRFWTSDLTPEYVRFNSQYTT
jgi:glutamate N-acetyltransferase/amino-acid N-acetyltransferase